ncbi:hypothetical protein WMF18_01755 [Sorangium sp. So ce315]|uniref:hypothetical protein n=1 Tax=Sorangium sp. So ce315 TaxID=3133299 RepID=UPI003F63220F
MNISTSKHQPSSGAPAGGRTRSHSRTRYSDSFVSALGLRADASDAAIEAELITQLAFGRFLLELTGASTPEEAKARIDAGVLLELTGASTPEEASARVGAMFRERGWVLASPSRSVVSPPPPPRSGSEPLGSSLPSVVSPPSPIAPTAPPPAGSYGHRQVPPRAAVSDEVMAFETGADLSVVRMARAQVQAALHPPTGRAAVSDEVMALEMGVDVATARQAREMVQAAIKAQG